MPEFLSNSIEGSVHLGEYGANKKVLKSIENVAKIVYTDQILNPFEVVDVENQESNARDLVKNLGMNEPFDVEGKIDSVEKLNELENNPTAFDSQKEKAKERLDILSKGIFEAMLTTEDEEWSDLIGAGSALKIDEKLPIPFKGLGERIVKNNITNEAILTKLRDLDDVRANCDMNNPADRQVMFEEVLMAYGDLTRTKNLTADEREQLYMVKAYLNTELQVMGGGEEIKEKTSNVHVNRVPPEVYPMKATEDKEGGWEQRSYDMTYKRFCELEMEQINPNWFPARPPEWYSAMDKEGRKVVDARVKLLEAAATKLEVRNKLPVEKLRGIKPELKGKEFMALWENMSGFKEALSVTVKDLCTTRTDSEGRIFLILKDNNVSPDDIKKDPSKGEVSNLLLNMEGLKSHVAKKIESDVAKKEKEEDVFEKSNEAASAAWNFLFLGDAIEAWDYYRQFSPSDLVSDKLRTVFHLRAKFLGKSGIYKVNPIKKESWGEEEPFISNQLFQWVAHNLDENKEEFSNRVLNGDLKDIVPDTMAVSMIELMPAYLSDGRETSMALALLGKDQNGKEVTLDQIKGLKINDANIMQTHNDMVQGADWIAQAIKGDQPLDMNKNLDAWAKMFVESTALTRQEPVIPILNAELRDNFGKLPFPDNPMFYWSVLINSVGFNSSDKFPLLDVKKLAVDNNVAVASNYDLAIRDLLDVIAVRSRVDRKIVKEKLGAANMMDYMKKKFNNDRKRFQKLPIF